MLGWVCKHSEVYTGHSAASRFVAGAAVVEELYGELVRGKLLYLVHVPGGGGTVYPMLYLGHVTKGVDSLPFL